MKRSASVAPKADVEVLPTAAMPKATKPLKLESCRGGQCSASVAPQADVPGTPGLLKLLEPGKGSEALHVRSSSAWALHGCHAQGD